jgi:uncharacterized membrane protein
MIKLLAFYTTYGFILDGFFIWLRIFIFVLFGIITANYFNKSTEKDLTGIKKLLATMFISFIIYFFIPSIVGIKFILGTALVMGYGADKLMVDWRNKKIWKKFDVLNKIKKGD